MKVQFKGRSEAFSCTEPVEQKVFQSGKAAGWALMFRISGAVNSSDIDELTTPEAISEIVFTGGTEEAPSSVTLVGYNTVRSCTIRYTDNGATVELQFTKEATENGTV